ncbi:MAG: hypothetical protein WCW66_06580 [Patescibacteria group bacterium]|jgi:hypothetical protein
MDTSPGFVTTLEGLDARVNTWLMNKNIEVHHVNVVHAGDRCHRVGVIMFVFYTENAE